MRRRSRENPAAALGVGALALGAVIVGGGLLLLAARAARTVSEIPMDDAADVAAVAFAYPRSLPVAAQVVALARTLGVKPAWIANVIDFESGHSWNPAAVNPASGATGLIQFMPHTAPELGTTTAALARMSAAEQLAYVARYFLLPRIPKPLRSQLDVFMAVYYPAAVGHGPAFAFPQSTWAGNPGIRVAGDYYALAMRNAKMAA